MGQMQVKPSNCSCEYPETVFLTRTGHDDRCAAERDADHEFPKPAEVGTIFGRPGMKH